MGGGPHARSDRSGRGPRATGGGRQVRPRSSDDRGRHFPCSVRRRPRNWWPTSLSVGDQVAKRQVGERVLVPFQPSCGSCTACLDDRFAACHRFRAPAGGAFGFGSAGGGHRGAVADVVAVPYADHLLVPAPEGISAAVLCTLPDNLVDAYRTVGPQLSQRPGAEVLIVGSTAPSVGLYTVALALALGAGNVFHRPRPWPV